MRIFIRVKPGAKKEFIRKVDGTHFVAAVKEPPREGRANDALRRKIAKYLHVPPSGVAIVSGRGARDKIFEIAHYLVND